MPGENRENSGLHTFFVIKHSWTGKLKRILEVGKNALTAYNPASLEATNVWPYKDVVSLSPATTTPNFCEFLLTVRKPNRKIEQIRFSSEQRTEIITEALRFSSQFEDRSNCAVRHFSAYKFSWNDSKRLVVLRVGQTSISYGESEEDSECLHTYNYKDIEYLVEVRDFPNGLAIAHSGFSRLHTFVIEERDEFVKCVQLHASTNLSLDLHMRLEPCTLEDSQLRRFGSLSADEALTSLVEFNVLRMTPRGPQRRVLCLTGQCIAERDAATYNVRSLRPLSHIWALIRADDDPQRFVVEFVCGASRYYESTEREAILATLLDGARASGNRDVCVRMVTTQRAQRAGVYGVPVAEEMESQCLRWLCASQRGPLTLEEALDRFNANVSYSGLQYAVTQDSMFAVNKEKLINAALASLIHEPLVSAVISDSPALSTIIRRQPNNSKASEAMPRLLNTYNNSSGVTNEQIEKLLQTLHRLFASKAGFQAFTQISGLRDRLIGFIVRALARQHDAVSFAAIDTLNALMQPLHDDFDLAQEQMNKAALLASKKFLDRLLEVFTSQILKGSNALVILALLDFLTFALCTPYSETTLGNHFDQLLGHVAVNGHALYKLLQHPCNAIVKGAGLLIKVLIEESDDETCSCMLLMALNQGALLRQLRILLFTQSSDPLRLTSKLLSHHLLTLWTADNAAALTLLRNLLPLGLFIYLQKSDMPPADTNADSIHARDIKLPAHSASNQDQLSGTSLSAQQLVADNKLDRALEHWRTRLSAGSRQRPQGDDLPQIVLRKRRPRLLTPLNWPLLLHHFQRDHASPSLIWNYKTREELREAIDNELRMLDISRELNGKLSTAWNYHEFQVRYASLNDEIKIGDFYLRLLLKQDLRDDGDQAEEIMRSREFFNDLYHHFLLAPKLALKMMCLQAMTIIYGRYFEQIGPFNDTKDIVSMLHRTCDRLERDRLLQLLSRLILHHSNVKHFIDAGGIRILVDLLTLAHLQKSSAYLLPMQSNAIEAGTLRRDVEKEWYYLNSTKEKLGPFSLEEMKNFYTATLESDAELVDTDTARVDLRTLCWASGMEGWKPLVHVAQLKWCLAASGQPLLSESELACLALDILIQLCSFSPSRDTDGAIIQPISRIKRVLCEAGNLVHVVQLLLTFRPAIVEKVAVLLNHVMMDNPCVSQLYLTGVFYFLLMYNGSNILPIMTFLKNTHLKQACGTQLQDSANPVVSASVLSRLLPEAMVCYLDNNPAEKFAQIFLGEFDSPEVIWNGEMRQYMIEAIAKHLADFSPRLFTNVRASYQYCPMPLIAYPQLEHELYVNIFYLRRFCDTKRFPDWPVHDPVGFLKDILESWKYEMEKQPPSMSLDDALRELELGLSESSAFSPSSTSGPDGVDELAIRKAYLRLAHKYHPDKNPDGREMFERVSKAYELLCMRTKCSYGPDQRKIALLLRAQSILFARFHETLAPYKYAGYPMLMRTVQLETRDTTLFNKPVPLLPPATELCYRTMHCSALNAEELRREGGLECLMQALDRCLGVVTSASRANDLPVQVCLHVVNCCQVAASFEACRTAILEQPRLVADLCRLLELKNLPDLCIAVANCCAALCVDVLLQTGLFKAGVHFVLLGYLFTYDFTLEDSGIEKSASTHQQELLNTLARSSLSACAALGGYLHGTPQLPEVRRMLYALLTPFLARRLNECDCDDVEDEVAAKCRMHELLKLLNSNTENPHLIWNNATRAELTHYLSMQLVALQRCESYDEQFGAEFQYSAHQKEFTVGDVFVRLYIQQKHFPLYQPHKFAVDLLEFISSAVQKCYSQSALKRSVSLSDDDDTYDIPENLTSLTTSLPLESVDSDAPLAVAFFSDELDLQQLEMALEALLTVLLAYPGSEQLCIGNFKLLFALFRLAENRGTVLQHTLGIVHAVISNNDCVTDIAQACVVHHLLTLIEAYPAGHQKLLEVLYALASNSKIIKELVSKGAVVYLLDIYTSATVNSERVRSAELLARMFTDKLVGPKVRLLLNKFLPSIFLDAMRDAPETSVHLFETVHENPELIWNDEWRTHVTSAIRTMKLQHYAAQRINPDARWSITADFTLIDSLMQGEVFVGGVYIRLFIQNSSWVLRKPREFLVDIFNTWSRLVLGAVVFDGEQLEMISTALVLLLRTRPDLVDALPEIGYIPKVFQAMTLVQNEAVPRSALLICEQLARSQFCVRVISCVPDAIAAMQVAMRARRDCVHVAASAFASMMECGDEDLYEQAMQCDLLLFLLTLLESPSTFQSENQAATRALIVNAIKAIQSRTLKFSEEVNNILDRSITWRSYRDQKHDLFLASPTAGGFLTAMAPQVAGYLMSNITQPVSNVPPPDTYSTLE